MTLRRLLPRSRSATFPSRSQSCVFPCSPCETPSIYGHSVPRWPLRTAAMSASPKPRARESNIRTGRCKNLSFGACTVPHWEPRTGLDQCQRYGFSHGTETDEADRVCCVHHRAAHCSACVHPLRAGLLLFGLSPLRQIFLGQRGSGRLGLHHDARHPPAVGFLDRLNAVDAARDLLAVAAQRVAAP